MPYAVVRVILMAGLAAGLAVGGLFGPASSGPIQVADGMTTYPSPDGRWTAVVDRSSGSLDVMPQGGPAVSIFPAGSTIYSVAWSPDSRHLLAVRTNWVFREPRGTGVDAARPIEIWRVDVPPTASSAGGLCKDSQPPDTRLAQCLFQSVDAPETAAIERGTEQIVFGHWSPNSRDAAFWLGPLSASILADGLTPYVLDISSGQATRLADIALLNSRYHSWAPDGSALVMTAGGYRSALVDKWLILFSVASQRVTTAVDVTEQIPGIVAWSPRGDWVAYAAVPSEETGSDLADWMSWDNPAIAGRRIYLLDPATGEHYRLNDADAFQDAPLWSDDGAVLYYAERQDDALVLMAAELGTGRSQLVPGATIPLPEVAGYYGQSDLDALLALRPGGQAAPPAASATATASATPIPTQ